ncbi:MAG: efflux RND transporter permease subunit [Gemmatimonadales bacterium]
MIRWAAGRPAVVWATAAAIIAAGGVAFSRLPLATRPVVELPRLEVITSWPGASPELVETYITSPLEAAIQAVRGVKKVSSESDEASSQLTIDLEPDANVQLTRLAILERIELLRKDFPRGASPPQVSNYVPDDLQEEPLLRYTIYGPYTPATLARIAKERIEPVVSSVEGVAGVNSGTWAQIGISVSYDAQRLRQLGIDPSRITQAIAASRVVQSVGKERAGSTERPVVLRDQPHAVEDLNDLPIRASGGRVFHLGEIASVRLEEDSRDAFYRVNGKPAVGMSIARLPGADAIKTADRVRTQMNVLRPTLPPGVVMRLESDESVDLAKQLRDLAIRGGIAFFCVMLVLGVSLRNAKSVLLVMGSAAVAIAGTALGLYLLDIPANLLTLAGLGMGIGILVQNGLVVVERLRTTPDTADGRAEAGRRILPAIVGATLTTLVVLLPFLYLQGNSRAAFVPFAVAFALALGCSVLSSVVMIPALGAGHGVRSGHWPRLTRFYTRIVMGLLRYRPLTLIVVATLLGIVTWGFVQKVPHSAAFNWGGQRTALNVYISFPRGSDPAALDRAMQEFERLVVGEEGVELVTTQGTRDGASMRVTFARDAEYGPQPYRLQEVCTQRGILIGGATISVQGVGPGFYSGGGGGSASFRIKVLGYSFAGVEQLAYDLKARLERIPRVKDVDANAASFWRREKTYNIVLDPDRAALARYGLTVRDFSAAVAREVRGQVGATRIEIGDDELPVNVKAEGARDRNLAELRDAIVPTPEETPVRLTDLARVDEQEGLSYINREDQQYVRIVSYEFRGPQKLANRTHEAFMASISVPPGYSVADDQFFWGVDESGKGLWLVFAVGVVLVILAVAMVFDSVWASGVVFLSLPIALAGSAAAFWIAKASFGREAAVGVILVVGLAVNQAILLVDAALERRAGWPAGRRAVDRLTAVGSDGVGSGRSVRLPARPGLSGWGVVSACRDRVGMITLVTFTTLASLLPLAIGTKSDELFGNIALATVGGTLAGTIGALFIVPAMVLGRAGGPAGGRAMYRRERGLAKILRTVVWRWAGR